MVARQSQRHVYRQEGIIADDVHAQCGRIVGDQTADRAQTDDAEGLALDFGTDKLALALLHHLADLIAVALEGFRPRGGGQYVSGREDHRAQHQLGYGVGVRAGGVEDNDALFRALVKRNVVDARARSCDGEKAFGQLHVVHGRRADQHCVGILGAVGAGVAFTEAVESDLCDFI